MGRDVFSADPGIQPDFAMECKSQKGKLWAAILARSHQLSGTSDGPVFNTAGVACRKEFILGDQSGFESSSSGLPDAIPQEYRLSPIFAKSRLALSSEKVGTLLE